MNDFREASTMELFFSITTDFKIKMKRFEELFKEQVLKMTSKPENKDIRKELKNEKDFKIANKKMKKLTVLELEKQAEEGDVESQFCLGNYYFILDKEGDNEENNKKAFKWYKKAAENGLSEAQYNLANFYMNGLGTDESQEKAFEWYKKAAEQGHIESNLCLAICYEQGIGTDVDEEKAFNIAKSIEDKNNPSIEYCLGVYYEQGIGTDIDLEKAFDCYKNCANKGYDKGQLRVAYCYENGIGVKQDYKKAFNRYKKAMSNGNEDAKYLVGHCYEEGIGTNVDYKKAFSIYEELYYMDHEDGTFKLAQCYENGIGTDVDKEEAFKLYNELASIDNEDAKFYLAQCNEISRKNNDAKDDYIEESCIEYDEEGIDQEFDESIDTEYDISLDKIDEIQEDDYDTDVITEVEGDIELEDDILFSDDLNINVFLEQTIFKQVTDKNLESDLKKLVVKIDKCLNSTNGALNFKSLGFKKYEGVNNKIYGFDFNNKVNDSDRIIACFVEDYAKKNEFDFERYINSDNKDKQGIILFSIAKHNDQEREALKVSKKINSNFYKEDKFKSLNKNKGKKTMLRTVASDNNMQENNMTFRSMNFNDKEIIYQEVLTKEQAKNINSFIQKSEPFILSGIAGSGKTLSTISLIPDMVEKTKNNGTTDKILYVTFSNNLKEYVKSKVMESYYELNEYVDIRTFEDICTEINYKYNNKKIDRSKIITQNSYDKSFTKFLNWLYRTSRDNNILKFIKKYENEKNIIYSEIFGILKGSMYVDWDRKESNIVKSEYYIKRSKKIVEDYKIFSEDDREVIYSITEKYNDWLVENGYYDINDIAFELQSLIQEKSISYEYVVIDEVQDFTEVQIYMLFLLAKEQEIYGKNKTRKILLAGDPNQIINPTFFKIGRLTKLFYLYGYKYEVQRLNENFRNSINIMKMNNIVNGIINEKLPARKEEDRQDEVTKNNKSGIIEQLKATENNLKIVFREIDASAKVALIVSDDERKEYLKEKYDCKSAFTISEFKGKEFDNIIAYNILSDYADIYEEIYKKEDIKEGHYSYYFNRFYVSITRANYNLVLIEEKETQILNEIKEKLGDDLKYIESISCFKDLNLGEIVGDSIDLFNLGMKFFNDEKYSVAKNYFIRSVEPNSNKLADLCDLFEEDGNYEERGDKLFEIGEYKLAQGYYQKAYEFSKFAIMYLYIDSLSYEKQLKEFYNCLEKENIDFSDLYDEYSSKFDKLNDILRHKIFKTEKLQSEIQEKMNSINKMIKNINSKFN